MARQIGKVATAAAVLTIALTLSACTSVESARNSKETGFVHRFAAPYRQVLDAMPAAIEAVKLRVIESMDTANGTRVIVARKPTSALYLSYYVRITIKEVSVAQTEVEVLSEGQFADMSSGKNIGNSSDLFLEIGKRVYGT